MEMEAEDTLTIAHPNWGSSTYISEIPSQTGIWPPAAAL